MKCKPENTRDDHDTVQTKASNRVFDKSATAWLIGQSVRYLNTAGESGEFEYKRTVELLRACNRDVFETIKSLFNAIKNNDATLRWNLLYILGDSADERAADFLLHIILRELAPEESGCCESQRDMEVLVAIAAVNALHKIAERHKQVAEYFLKIIGSRPEQAIQIEAIKAALSLGLQEQVQNTLNKEEHWQIEIRRVRPQEMYAEPEREDGKERSFSPPKSAQFSTSPKSCHCHEED